MLFGTLWRRTQDCLCSIFVSAYSKSPRDLKRDRGLMSQYIATSRNTLVEMGEICQKFQK